MRKHRYSTIEYNKSYILVCKIIIVITTIIIIIINNNLIICACMILNDAYIIMCYKHAKTSRASSMYKNKRRRIVDSSSTLNFQATGKSTVVTRSVHPTSFVSRVIEVRVHQLAESSPPVRHQLTEGALHAGSHKWTGVQSRISEQPTDLLCRSMQKCMRLFLHQPKHPQQWASLDRQDWVKEAGAYCQEMSMPTTWSWTGLSSPCVICVIYIYMHNIYILYIYICIYYVYIYIY